MYLAFRFRAKIWKIHAFTSLIFYACDHFFQMLLRCNCRLQEVNVLMLRYCAVAARSDVFGICFAPKFGKSMH